MRTVIVVCPFCKGPQWGEYDTEYPLSYPKCCNCKKSINPGNLASLPNGRVRLFPGDEEYDIFIPASDSVRLDKTRLL